MIVLFFYKISSMSSKIIGFLLLMFGFTTVAQQQNGGTIINVKDSADRPISVAVVPFFKDSSRASIINELVRKNFEISGFINPLAEENMVSLPYKPDQVSYNDWEELGVEYILIGSVVNDKGKQFKVELYLFDILQQSIAMTFQGIYKEKELVELANSISDSVIEKITGLKGIFTTKVAYVEQVKNRTRNIYYLKVSYLNGSDSQIIFTSYQPIISVDWSPNGRDIAYLSYDSKMPSVVIHNIKTGRRQVLGLDRATTSSPAWSPDGEYLLFTLSRNGISDIYKYTLANSKVERLVHSKAIDTLANISDDGKRVVFTSDRFNYSPNLMMLNLDTNQISRITKTGAYNDMGKFIDSDRIAFIRQGDDRIFSLNIYYLNSETIEQLTFKNDVESIDVSPNGEYVVYTEVINKANSNVRIYNLKTKRNFFLFKGEKNNFIREASWSGYLE